MKLDGSLITSKLSLICPRISIFVPKYGQNSEILCAMHTKNSIMYHSKQAYVENHLTISNNYGISKCTHMIMSILAVRLQVVKVCGNNSRNISSLQILEKINSNIRFLFNSFDFYKPPLVWYQELTVLAGYCSFYCKWSSSNYHALNFKIVVEWGNEFLLEERAIVWMAN